MKVYLAGPPYADEYRRRANALVGEIGWEAVDPMRRDYRGRTEGKEAEIVTGDLLEIDPATRCSLRSRLRTKGPRWRPGTRTPSGSPSSLTPPARRRTPGPSTWRMLSTTISRTPFRRLHRGNPATSRNSVPSW